MAKISVIITIYNSSKVIKTCLESLTWADEIVVVDVSSTDDAAEMVKKYTDKIYRHKNYGYVEPVRNFAISKATGDWILIVDADEEIPETLAKKLRAIADEQTGITHVLLPRKNIIFGKWMQHTGWWPDHIIRFFQKGCVRWKDEIHSVPSVEGQGISLEGEELAIIHQNYQTIMQFIQRNLENYALREAKELQEKGYKFAYIDAIRFPTKEFLSRYFAREGYKDGFHGLILSLLMAVYHFVIFLHLWEENKFKQLDEKTLSHTFSGEVKQVRKEFLYWMTKREIERAQTPVKKLFLKAKRKFL